MKRQDQEKKQHRLSLADRSLLEMNGVGEVITFDEHEIRLETSLGPLVITGEELNIRTLDLESGLLKLEGKVNRMDYISSGKMEGFLARLFR